MAKKKGKKDDQLEQLQNLPEKIIRQQFTRLRWVVITTSIVLILLTVGGIYWFRQVLNEQPITEWFPEAAIAGLAMVIILIVTAVSVASRQRKVRILLTNATTTEFEQLRAASRQAKALQEMANTLRASQNLDRVLDAALNACTVGMQEMGIPERSIVASVRLYENEQLIEIVGRRTQNDGDLMLNDRVGAIGTAMKNAEPIVINEPKNDPAIGESPSFRRCYTVVCVPLRLGFQIYGLMIIGSGIKMQFDEQHLDLFMAVADQAVIALQNAQLFQDLESEKARLIQAETDARKELARDLHDGPTQSVAAIAMRINFVRSLIKHDLDEAVEELFKIENLAKKTAKDIRGMLFTLRPLVLETQGLGAAIETVMGRIQESEGIKARLVGGEYGDLLLPKAQGVIFYIIEEALGNARKHSQANLLEVRMWQEDGLFVTRIQDDGVGFDVGEVMGGYETRGSLGMINLRERAEMIDGSIQIDSEPGRGTNITLVVPLDKQGR